MGKMRKTGDSGKTNSQKKQTKRETKSTSGTDWEAIRLDYVTSIPKKSHKDLAQQYGVTYSAVRSHAYKEKWKDARQKHLDDVSTLTGQIVDENITEKRALMLSQAKSCGVSFFLAAAQQGLVAMSDPHTFYRNDRVRTRKDADGNFLGYDVINLIGSEFDAVGYSQLVRAMDVVMERLDKLDGKLNPLDQARIELMRDKFSLDKKKAGMDEDDDRAGVIIIPGQIMPELPEDYEEMSTEDYLELVENSPNKEGDAQ